MQCHTCIRSKRNALLYQVLTFRATKTAHTKSQRLSPARQIGSVSGIWTEKESEMATALWAIWNGGDPHAEKENVRQIFCLRSPWAKPSGCAISCSPTSPWSGCGSHARIGAWSGSWNVTCGSQNGCGTCGSGNESGTSWNGI